MTMCTLCPRSCRKDRSKEAGACDAGPDIVVGSIVIHRGEEPPLVTGKGSGAVFFSGCPLKCSFCQNRQISHEGLGSVMTEEELSSHMLTLQEDGCSNINLVSPTHFAPAIRRALDIAKDRGMTLPVMLNSSGYESIEALTLWKGYAGLFLMDLKYGDNETGKRLSRVSDYWDRAKEAVSYLWDAYGSLVTDEEGRAVSGMIVRHLVLPGMLSNPFSVLEFLSEISLDIPVSIMSQYNPAFYHGPIPEMGRSLMAEEYEVVLERAVSIGFTTMFVQDMDSTSTYVPDFLANTPFGDCVKIF